MSVIVSSTVKLTHVGLANGVIQEVCQCERGYRVNMDIESRRYRSYQNIAGHRSTNLLVNSRK